MDGLCKIALEGESDCSRIQTLISLTEQERGLLKLLLEEEVEIYRVKDGMIYCDDLGGNHEDCNSILDYYGLWLYDELCVRVDRVKEIERKLGELLGGKRISEE